MCKRVWMLCVCLLIGAACDGQVPKGVAPPEEPPVPPVPSWEKPSGYDRGYISDLALIYGGGRHRTVAWNEASFTPHVVYTDRNDREFWLFDGFLLIEFTLAKGDKNTNQILATGYYGQPARKVEWQELLDYYFTRGVSVDALDKSVGRQIGRIGYPAYRRQVVLTLPEPIVGGPGSNYAAMAKDYWGAVDGRQLDFTRTEDRLAACKWYIDTACEMFEAGGYENVELAGFYWVAEEMLHSRAIIEGVARYIHDKGLRFEWIPYWKDKAARPDYYDWKSYGFDKAYLQPNYFFAATAPAGRLEAAVEVIKKYDLGYEIEFDENAVESTGGTKRMRLYSYMKAFRESGVFAGQPLAYYMGGDGFLRLKSSSSAVDRQTFDDLCMFVYTHQWNYLKTINNLNQ